MSKVHLAGLASRQWGRVHWRQLREAGVSQATISAWVSTGYLHRVLPRVYAVGHIAAGPEADLAAALLFAGPGAMLSHATAAWWWGLLDRQPSFIDISTPKRCESPNSRINVHSRRKLERTWHRRLPLTTVAQTLIDFASEAPPGRLKRVLAEADYRRLLDVVALQRLAGRGRPGSGALRQALEAHRPDLARTRSELEQRFVELCIRGHIPPPELNVTVCGLMVDALWRDQRLIVELDGRAAHGTQAQLARDHERDLRLRAAGFRVLRYSWRQVTRAPALVLADLRRELRLD
jgi:hypothetical protein